MTVKSCICTKQFEEAVKRVHEKDYRPIGDALHKETKRSMDELSKILHKKENINESVSNSCRS